MDSNLGLPGTRTNGICVVIVTSCDASILWIIGAVEYEDWNQISSIRLWIWFSRERFPSHFGQNSDYCLLLQLYEAKLLAACDLALPVLLNWLKVGR